MKKILVTGGSGFIGHHLCKRLLDDGNKVICIDNFSSGDRNNLEYIKKHKNFTIIEHDVIYPFHTEVDEIFNLACPASPVVYQKYPVNTLKTSLLGAMNMLELAVKCNAKILQSSTSEVYGDPEIHPQHENYYGNVNINGNRACYKESKRCVETLFTDYHRQFNVDIRIIRLFNVYGTGIKIDDGRVISNFVTQALLNKDITIMGDGTKTRAFCYIDDAISGMISLMNSTISTPTNVGNPNEFTITEIAKKIIDLTNSKSKIIHLDAQLDDSKQHQPNITKAILELNWKPLIEVEEGLKIVIEYYKQKLKK